MNLNIKKEAGCEKEQNYFFTSVNRHYQSVVDAIMTIYLFMHLS